MKSVEEIIEDLRQKLANHTGQLLLEREDAAELVRYFDNIDAMKETLRKW